MAQKTALKRSSQHLQWSGRSSLAATLQRVTPACQSSVRCVCKLLEACFDDQNGEREADALTDTRGGPGRPKSSPKSSRDSTGLAACTAAARVSGAHRCTSCRCGKASWAFGGLRLAGREGNARERCEA
eukprot:scaffold63_cov306-Pinguiococcus_pyrenoidosus.AAC.35